MSGCVGGSSIGPVPGCVGGSIGGGGFGIGGSPTGSFCGSSFGVHPGRVGGSCAGVLSGFGGSMGNGILRSIRGRLRDALPEQTQPEVLRHVGVLVLVDQDVAEARLILPQHLRLFPEQTDIFDQEVAEIGSVEHLQPLLIGDVELLAAPAREARGLAVGHLFRRQPAVLPAIDQTREHARRPALLVDALGGEQLLEQPDLVVDIEDGKIRLEAHHLGVPAQNLHPDRMEGAEPGHALDHAADHRADALLHLARGLVGEGDAEDFRRPRPPCREDVGDAGGEHAGLAGSRPGEHQYRPVERNHRLALLRIEVGEIGRRHGPARPRRDAAGGGRVGEIGRMLEGLSQGTARG